MILERKLNHFADPVLINNKVNVVDKLFVYVSFKVYAVLLTALMLLLLLNTS